jgi:hypothetical protein
VKRRADDDSLLAPTHASKWTAPQVRPLMSMCVDGEIICCKNHVCARMPVPRNRVISRPWSECDSRHRHTLQLIVCLCRCRLHGTQCALCCFLLFDIVDSACTCFDRQVLCFGICGKRHGFSIEIVLAYALNCFYLNHSVEQPS